MKHPRICVVGSANIDLTFRTPRFPHPGETLTGHALHLGMGGKGANQAVAAARLGADVTFIACVGNDAFGKAAMDAYTAEGINTTLIRQVEDQPTGTAAILVDDEAENCIIVVAGANAELCVPNKTEISTLTGRAIRSNSDALRAAKKLCERGVKRVALTMGGDGVFLLDESGSAHVPAMKVDAVDTTGAGDAFTAALAVALAEGRTFSDSARWASMVAAISVTRLGTQTAFPRREEVSE